MSTETLTENAEAVARAELDQSARDIARFLAPRRGVAFVGSADLSPAMRRQMARYGDIPLCIVNPKGGTAGSAGGDVPIYKSIAEVPDEIDLAVVRVAAKRTMEVIEECGRRGIRDVLMFSDGFAEVGAEGAALEKDLAAAAKRAGVRILGPNTNDNAFERYPVPQNHRGGMIAVITQSGANGRSVVEGIAMGAGFARWVTTGNEVDLEVADFINYFVLQPEVRAIALYVEGFKSVPKLRLALERAMAAGKPVVAIKMGSTKRGAKTAASHTGHLTGADAVVNGLFRQYGVTRVYDVDELLEIANLFAKLPPGTGPRCAMYTISGGTAALMAETADMNGVQMPELSAERQEALHAHIPRSLNVRNPIDNGGVFVMRAAQDERLKVLNLLAADPEIDVIVFGLNAAYGPLSDRMASDILAWAPTAPKPVVAIWTSVVIDTQGYADLVASGVPIFRSFKKCMRGLAAHADYVARQKNFRPRNVATPQLTSAQRQALNARGVLSSAAAATVLKDAGVTLVRETLAATPAETAKAAADIGFPVVLKLSSPDVPHKTDLGLVRTGVMSAKDAEAIASDFLARTRAAVPHARIDGIVVQQQIKDGVEMIVGLTRDPQFGPALTIGAGGVHAEVMKDVAVVPLPADAADVREMIAGLRMAPLLAGVRGAPAADIDSFVALVIKVAGLALAAGARLEELDLNPVIVSPHGAVAVDSLVVAGDG